MSKYLRYVISKLDIVTYFLGLGDLELGQERKFVLAM